MQVELAMLCYVCAYNDLCTEWDRDRGGSNVCARCARLTCLLLKKAKKTAKLATLSMTRQLLKMASTNRACHLPQKLSLLLCRCTQSFCMFMGLIKTHVCKHYLNVGDI